MTRVNVIPVSLLSDLWLLAEYRELPRCIKQQINTDDASEQYVLGKGHMKWAKHHSIYLLRRYKKLCDEMEFRGFKVNYPYEELCLYNFYHSLPVDCRYYTVIEADVALNCQRLLERYRSNPTVHKWTNRNKPEFLQCQQ